ncbi:hypothetical protein chiPu_0013718 [Chiloscyllium punctatum]|uniref:Uncharacterized protein n=1 Tax=Chiloscyllium punctatum TaxID=137246 RepID=A0A401SXW7_CHIPU|nr:hypothetical protein [Chiloscyllium punctatum]
MESGGANDTRERLQMRSHNGHLLGDDATGRKIKKTGCQELLALPIPLQPLKREQGCAIAKPRVSSPLMVVPSF